jgi:alkylation response protein AidB-like acyl-CoA dehydrogenase
MKLRAARALAFDVTGEAWAVARSGEVPPPRLQAAMRAAAREATDVAIDVAAMAYRYAGGGGLFETDPIQRALRDVQAASQHFVVADSAFEALGQLRLGIEGAHPMQ